MMCYSGIFILVHACCIEADVHTTQDGNGEHTPQHV